MPRTLFAAALLLAGCAARGGEPPSPAPEAPPGRAVGYRVLDLPEPPQGGGPLTVAVWYPTTGAPAAHCYGGPAWGRVAVDGEPDAAGGPYPLLVFSHGYGGGGLAAVFFTEWLAARGWIVAAPDHHDRHCAVRIRGGAVRDFDRLGLLRHAREIAASGPADRANYLYRLDELSLTMDGVLAAAPFAGLIDRERIAAGGHSFGGFTALGLCGTIPERRDPRLKGVLLFSTGAGAYLFTGEELARVRLPALCFLGERERGQRRGAATMAELTDGLYRSLSAPKYLAEVRGADHFSFNNCFSDTRAARALSGRPEEFAAIRRYAVAFLERHVAGREDGGVLLEAEPDALLTRFLREPDGAGTAEQRPAPSPVATPAAVTPTGGAG